jgi:hypothetical protein
MKKVERLTSSDAIFAPNIANQERNNTIHPSQFKRKEDERNGWYASFGTPSIQLCTLTSSPITLQIRACLLTRKAWPPLWLPVSRGQTQSERIPFPTRFFDRHNQDLGFDGLNDGQRSFSFYRRGMELFSPILGCPCTHGALRIDRV